MSRIIQIRNVPDDVRRKLKIRAVKVLAREARRLAEQPTLEEMRERLLSRPGFKPAVPPADVVREERDRR